MLSSGMGPPWVVHWGKVTPYELATITAVAISAYRISINFEEFIVAGPDPGNSGFFGEVWGRGIDLEPKQTSGQVVGGVPELGRHGTLSV